MSNHDHCGDNLGHGEGHLPDHSLVDQQDGDGEREPTQQEEHWLYQHIDTLI